MAQRDEQMITTVLEARGLTRSFGEHYALVELNATWRSHEICALLGPNGSGKSTLLNLLSTLMAPSEGDLYIEGQRLTRANRASLAAHIGFVGHQTMTYEGLSALENLRFFADLYRAGPLNSESDRAAWLLERLEEVGLEHAAHRTARGFSRGMSQRLTLARALLAQPRILLLDEPFTGLDRSGIDQVCALLEVQRDRGACVILSSHDFETTERLVDRALVLKRGKRRAFDSIPREQAGALLNFYQASLE